MYYLVVHWKQRTQISTCLRAVLYLLPWKWRQQFIPKVRLSLKYLHDIISKKTGIFVFAVRFDTKLRSLWIGDIITCHFIYTFDAIKCRFTVDMSCSEPCQQLDYVWYLNSVTVYSWLFLPWLNQSSRNWITSVVWCLEHWFSVLCLSPSACDKNKYSTNHAVNAHTRVHCRWQDVETWKCSVWYIYVDVMLTLSSAAWHIRNQRARNNERSLNC